MLLDLDFKSPESYQQFLAVRRLPHYGIDGRRMVVPDEYAHAIGLEVEQSEHVDYEPASYLYDYQAAISRLAIHKKRFACFMECGTGKSTIILEFGRHVSKKQKKRTLILTPLMVAEQLSRESEKFYGEPIQLVRAVNLQKWLDGEGEMLAVTNYEAIREGLTRGKLGALILDESSSIKQHGAKWGTRLIELGKGLEYKLSCTGTPAPNDRIEFANQAVFLDRHRTVNAFLARYFVNRGQTQNRWELKPHALKPFYKDLSAWCIFLSDPTVYGWRSLGDIPEIITHIEEVPLTFDQQMAVDDLEEKTCRYDKKGRKISRGGIGKRSKLAQIAKGTYNGEDVGTLKYHYAKERIDSWSDTESTIIWCRYNYEQDRMAKMFPDAANIKGDTPYHERLALLRWFQGEICKCQMEREIKSGNEKGSTRKNTIRKTNTDGSHEHQSSELNTTQSGESNTHKTLNYEKSARNRLGSGDETTQKKPLSKTLERTESALSNTDLCELSSEESAQYAENTSPNSKETDSLSTIATNPEKFEDFFAQDAISESERLKTPTNYSNGRLCTCGGTKCKVLISKASVIGFGLNLQVATRHYFSSCEDSYESYHQAVKRSNRIGSTKPLNVHIAVTEIEKPMMETVITKRDRVDADTRMQEELFKEFHKNITL